LWLLLGSPLLAACGTTDEPVSGQRFALTAQENLEQALRGVSRAGSFAADSAALAKMLEPVADGGDGDCVAPAAAPCAPGQVCPAPATPACVADDAEVAVEDLQQARDEINEAIDELVDVLRERVFTPENLESEDATSATYLLGASFYCDESDDEASAPVPGSMTAPPLSPEPDTDCIEQANRWQTRLRLSSPSEGNIDVELLVSSERRNPATLELHRDHVAVVLDLGEYLDALRATGSDTGEVVALDGVVAAELRRHAELDYSLRYGVRESVHFAAVDEVNGETTDVSLGASFPVVELRLDGNQRTITGSYDLGTLDIRVPLENFRGDAEPSEADPGGNPVPPEAPYTGSIDAFLAGLEGSVTLDGTSDELRLVNLGLGDQSSTVKYGGELIAQLDVNPDQNRHFDVLAKKVDDQHTTLTFAPGLDARVLLNFAPLASQIPDLPDYLLGDTIRAFFTGENPTIEPLPGQVKVVAGTLNVTSERVPAQNLVVPAGSCLIDAEADRPSAAPAPVPSTPSPEPTPAPGTPAPAHELLGRFSVGACR
jgi:hypothetical protein